MRRGARLDRSILPIPPATEGSPSAIDLHDQSGPLGTDATVPPPHGAPNVVVVLLDDVGFGAASAFGGPCETPVAERLAGNGLRYTRFHTTAVCAPTRAALLTGRNHHSVGFGHLLEIARPRPGYDGLRPASAATIARMLAHNGFATGAFGKMHQTPWNELTQAGPFDRWPTGEGFEKFYGFLGGHTNQWRPKLYEGTTLVEQPRKPAEGYHLSEDLVDRAISWIRDVRSLRPEARFFCYLPFGATHEPFHVPRQWIDKYRYRFEQGWDRQRELTLQRQKEIGVVPESATLAPWLDHLPHWQELGEDERRAASALMEAYAGFLEHTDAQVGRLVDALSELGVLEDTLIFYILGDNGASSEGGRVGAVNLQAVGHSGPTNPADVLAQRDALGSPETWPHYAAGWALAMDTPFQWMKGFASHYGGTRNGLIVHWPNGISSRNEIRNQWHHVIDIVPTILEAAGLPHPAMVDGVVQMPIEGTAMNYSFDDANAPDRHITQYFELGGSRGVYHDGWVACTPHPVWELMNAPDLQVTSLRDDVWELYDTTDDWSQARDLAHVHPEKLERLKELFLLEAARHNVLPIDDLLIDDRWAGTTRRSMSFHAGARSVPELVVPSVANVSHSVLAKIAVPEGGAEGVICAEGGRFGGWSLYCYKGRLTYCHNVGAPPHFYLRSGDPLEPGSHEIRYEFVYEGGGQGKGGTGVLLVDARKVAEGRLARTITSCYFWGDGFDVGVDLYTTVSDELPLGENAFTGRIEWVRIDLADEPEVDPAEELRLAQRIQ